MKIKHTKPFCTALALALALATSVPAMAGAAYADVAEDAWYADAAALADELREDCVLVDVPRNPTTSCLCFGAL